MDDSMYERDFDYIKFGGSHEWTLEDLSELGSERIDKLMQQIRDTERLRDEKSDEIGDLGDEQEKGIDELSSTEYEDLGVRCEELQREYNETEERRRSQIQKLEKYVDLNSSKLYRSRKRKELEEKRAELNPYLDEIESLVFEPGNLLATRRELVGREKQFIEKLRKYDEVFGKWHDDIYKPFKEKLESVVAEKLSQFRDALLETKRDGTWKEEFKEVFHGTEACGHLDFNLSTEERHHGRYLYSGEYSYECVLTGRPCVQDDYDKRSKEFEYVHCPGYNLPKDLVSAVRGIWDKRGIDWEPQKEFEER